MNKNTMLVIAVAAVLLLGIGGYYFMNQGKMMNPSSGSGTTVTNGGDNSMQQQTLRGLMTSARNQECTFTDAETGNNGTMYIGQGQVRGDFTSQVNGQTNNSHMIFDGQNVHIWIDGQTTGFSANMGMMDSLQAQSGNTNTIDVDKEVDYECQGTTPDSALFTLPTDVTFRDIKAMMQESTQMEAQTGAGATTGETMMRGNASQCASCENLPPEAKAQCLQALNC